MWPAIVARVVVGFCVGSYCLAQWHSACDSLVMNQESRNVQAYREIRCSSALISGGWVSSCTTRLAFRGLEKTDAEEEEELEGVPGI